MRDPDYLVGVWESFSTPNTFLVDIRWSGQETSRTRGHRPCWLAIEQWLTENFGAEYGRWKRDDYCMFVIFDREAAMLFKLAWC
jgi:hypothetical protein